MKDNDDQWGELYQRVFNVAKEKNIATAFTHHQGSVVIGVYCTIEQVEDLVKTLGKGLYSYGVPTSIDELYFKRQVKG